MAKVIAACAEAVPLESTARTAPEEDHTSAVPLRARLTAWYSRTTYRPAASWLGGAITQLGAARSFRGVAAPQRGRNDLCSATLRGEPEAEARCHQSQGGDEPYSRTGRWTG